MPAPESFTAKELQEIWQENDCTRWRGWLDSYEEAIATLAAGASRGSEKLPNLDRWFREELPLRIKERTPPCIHADELQGLTAWKMYRGVWRERNRHLVASNSDEKVEETSREAFASIPDPRKPVATLATLSGVGPATASAALAALAPEIYPFFDEMVAAFIPSLGPVAFTVPYYLKYASALRERADLLNSTCSESGHRAWTVHDVAQALWTVGSTGQK